MPKWYGGSTLNPDELIPKKDQWTVQWRRVTRWFRRSEKIKKKAEVKELDESDIDVLIAFFQNCYYLRDWISDSRLDLKPKLDRFFEQHFEMRACRNICDGYKHKRLTSGKHPDRTLTCIGNMTTFSLTPSHQGVHYSTASLSPMIMTSRSTIFSFLQRYVFAFGRNSFPKR